MDMFASGYPYCIGGALLGLVFLCLRLGKAGRRRADPWGIGFAGVAIALLVFFIAQSRAQGSGLLRSVLRSPEGMLLLGLMLTGSLFTKESETAPAPHKWQGPLRAAFLAGLFALLALYKQQTGMRFSGGLPENVTIFSALLALLPLGYGLILAKDHLRHPVAVAAVAIVYIVLYLLVSLSGLPFFGAVAKNPYITLASKVLLVAAGKGIKDCVLTPPQNPTP